MAYGAGILNSSPDAPLQNLEAERALLGCMLLDNRRIAEAMEIIPPQARKHVLDEPRPRRGETPEIREPLFASIVHQEIFETVLELYSRDRAVDLVTLGGELDRRGRYEAIGGAPYLASLEEDTLLTIYMADYARVVVEKWRLRTLRRLAESIARDVGGSDEPKTIIDRAAQRLFDLSQQNESKDFQHVSEIAVQVMEEIEERFKSGSAGVTGTPTGFRELDRMTTGLRASNLIIVAARPAVGKSAFVMNIAAHIAVKHKLPVGFFSLEMGANELNERLLCSMARVPMGKVRANALKREEIDRLHAKTIELGAAPIYIDDSSDLSILELRAKARRLHQRAPDLGLIVVDYLQLMHAAGMKTDNRQQEVATISRSLKVLARDLRVPIIALSQLSRASEQRAGKTTKDKMPRLSDLRESGAIEQDADIVIFIHREFRQAADEKAARDEPDLATIRIAKQRNGPTGDFELLFIGQYAQFGDIQAGAQGPGGRH